MGSALLSSLARVGDGDGGPAPCTYAYFHDVSECFRRDGEVASVAPELLPSISFFH